MLVITSLLWCPGASTLAGPWEHAADSLGMCRPAALFDCWQTQICSREFSVTGMNPGSHWIVITKAKRFSSHQTADVPKWESGKTTVCGGFGLNLPVAAGKRQSCRREIWKQKNLQIIFFFFFLHHIIVTSSFSVDSYGWMVKYAPSPHIDEVSVSYLSWIFFSGLSSFLSSCHKQVSLIDWWLNYHLEENRRSAGKYVCMWSHNGLPICSGYTFPWPCHDSTISPQFCPPEGALARV